MLSRVFCVALLFLGGCEPSDTGPITSNGITITSAHLAGTTLTVAGDGFGTRAQAAPFFFQGFTDTPDGAGWQGIFDFAARQGGYIATDESTFHVDMNQGIGGGSFVLIAHMAPGGAYAGSEVFTHHGIFLPDVTHLYVSYWTRIDRLTTNPRTQDQMYAQIKGIRTGPVTDINDPISGMYHVDPMISFSWGGDLRQPMNPVCTDPVWNWGGADVGAYSCDVSDYHPPMYDDHQWHFIETEVVLNSPGVDNGIQRIWLDNRLIIDLDDSRHRTGGETMQYLQFSPGMSGDMVGDNWERRESRHYVDIGTRAKVFLGNAATLTACSGKFLLPATTWSNTGLSATLINRPTEYRWVYVMNAGGAVNETGYPLP